MSVVRASVFPGVSNFDFHPMIRYNSDYFVKTRIPNEPVKGARGWKFVLKGKKRKCEGGRTEREREKPKRKGEKQGKKRETAGA